MGIAIWQQIGDGLPLGKKKESMVYFSLLAAIAHVGTSRLIMMIWASATSHMVGSPSVPLSHQPNTEER